MTNPLLQRIPAATLAVLFLIAGCAAQTAHPAVHVSLQPLGWKRVPIVDADHEYETGMGAQRVVVDHSGKAYVGFLVPQKVELRSRGQANLIFRVAVIDTHTGKTLDVFNFPTKSERRTSLYLSPRDTLLVVADDQLHLVAHDHRELARFDLGDHLYIVWQSVTRKTILVDRFIGLGREVYTYLAPDSLKEIKHCSDEIPFLNSITDTRNYFEKGDGTMKPREIWAQSFCGSSAMRGELPAQVSGFYAVNDSTFFEYGDGQLDWMATGHGVTIADTVPKHHYLDHDTLRFPENGERVAAPLIKLKGDNALFDLSGTAVGMRINVYDRVSGSKVGSVWEPVVNRGKQRYYGDYPDFALSPDGKQLVVLYNGTVDVYDLP